jgi:hypothetical protein
MRSLLGALLLLLPSCVIYEDDGDPPDQSAVLVTGACPGGDWIAVDGYAQGATFVDVTVGYGGGCEEHDVWACWDGTILESSPPQLPFLIGHDDHDDACDAYITEVRRFALDDVIDAMGTTDFIVTVEGPTTP